MDSPDVAKRPDVVRSRRALADSHLASPIMINHYLDHLLSACLYLMQRVRGGQMFFERHPGQARSRRRAEPGPS
ncbi:hypothetical protein Misp01_54910 [Microtetraspora sp. NBRC 13810]|nr:hypothetical protein Misp01_54910 [Microtetraspora sp. NBRC 13810]